MHPNNPMANQMPGLNPPQRIPEPLRETPQWMKGTPPRLEEKKVLTPAFSLAASPLGKALGEPPKTAAISSLSNIQIAKDFLNLVKNGNISEIMSYISK